MRRILLVAGAIVSLANVAHADDLTPFCFSQYLNYLNYLSPQTSQSVGSAVVTFKLGERPCFFYDGEIDLGSDQRPDGNTVFELASITKVFTTAILGVREFNGLKVNSSVNGHLPPGYDLRPKEQGVTFQQLATFTGGFSWSDPPDFTKGHAFSQDDFVDAVNSLVPDDPIPGVSNLPTEVLYSNGSVGFLGQILMQMDSKDGPQYSFDGNGFSNWISDNLTGPLDMPNTRVHPGGTVATGYAVCKTCKSGYKQPVDSPFPWVPWGAAGALRSTTADMLKFLKANICAENFLDPACIGLPEELLEGLAISHHPNAYSPYGTLGDPTIYIGGCGSQNEQAWAWVYIAPPSPNPSNVTPIIWKNGGHPGFSTFIGFNPAKGYGLVILLNTGNIALVGAGKNMIQHTP